MPEIMAHHPVRSLVNGVREAGQYAVIMDETADLSIKEQVFTCFQIVRKNLETQEQSCGFFSIADTREPTLFGRGSSLPFLSDDRQLQWAML